MKMPQHLSWDNFKTTVFLRGEKRVHRVIESPRIEVFGDGVANRIGILLEIPSDSAIPPELSKLEFIDSRKFSESGRTFLEIATGASSLQRQFYHFAVAVAERVVVDNRPALDAVGLELECFTDLLEQKALLSPERQIGLLGELLFLQRLVVHAGADALDAWLGPFGEPHDFRITTHEFEVKTTVSPYRVHTIHGMEQLVASSGCTLYLLSILLGPPGADRGFSLAEKVVELRGQLAPVRARGRQFATALETYGFRNADTEHYNRQFAMRRPMATVPVDSSFPAITRLTIQGMLGKLADRIDAIQYDVSVEGLEYEDGTAGFYAAVPY